MIAWCFRPSRKYCSLDLWSELSTFGILKIGRYKPLPARLTLYIAALDLQRVGLAGRLEQNLQIMSLSSDFSSIT